MVAFLTLPNKPVNQHKYAISDYFLNHLTLTFLKLFEEVTFVQVAELSFDDVDENITENFVEKLNFEWPYFGLMVEIAPV